MVAKEEVESIQEGYITRCFYVTTNQGRKYTVHATILPITALLEVCDEEDREIPAHIASAVQDAVFDYLKREDERIK
jgi:hypothetical protein